MKTPLSWLKDYVDINVSPEELKSKLFGCGFEVEEMYEIGKDISGVVVGEVIECRQIEGTHLSECKVDCGDKGVFQICCGADNVKVGIKAPCALEGATVYATAKDHVTVEGVVTIKKGKLRGVESFGMLCSGAELGVNGDMFEGGDYCGLLLLPKEFKNGEDVKPLLGLNDYIFDIAVTPNRPDCQSIFGIAREVAAILKQPLREPDYSFKTSDADEKITVKNLAPELCPRYIAHYVKNVKIAPSPQWLKKRLALCGLRSISNVVDITNFVLLELGQPMHAFDLRNIAGGEIVVRRAKDGEKITTLDEKEFTLSHDNLVICDKQKPCALAGIMGGLNSEIKSDTSKVLFESAKFVRDNIRKSSRALGQRSDSSSLFEKGVYEYTTEKAMSRALNLIEKLGCGVVTDVHIDNPTEYSNRSQKTLSVSVKKINALLGIEVPTDTMREILENLNFGVDISGDNMKLLVPRYREDIDGYPDIAEEIIREYGYEHINGTFMPSALVTSGGLNAKQKAEKNLKNLLASLGLFEITSYSFISEKDMDLLRYPEDCKERKAIKIMNPISEELSIMRTTLAPSMVNVIVRNLRRRNMEGSVFELANIYIPKTLPLSDYPEERRTLSIGMWGVKTFFDLKGVCEMIASSLNTEFEYEAAEKPFLHGGMTANIKCDGEVIGYLGALSPVVSDELALDRAAVICEIDYEALTKHAKPFKYVPLPKFSEVCRDIALMCDKRITCASIEKEIKDSCKYVTHVKLFDIYSGKQVESGKKSLAFTITFTPKDAPLEDKVDGYVKKILKNLNAKMGITQR